MKSTILFVVLFLVQLNAAAQLFYFEDTSAVLIKTVNQSPAHWYLEILTDSPTDTTLRWKAHFVSVPSAWQINFDDQTTNHSPVEDGDSADFVLFGSPEYPQKLIIGATLNNTPGHGFVYFDIYDPLTPQDVQTISYEFIISPFLGLEDLLTDQYILNNGFLRRRDEQPFNLEVFDLEGRCMQSRTAVEVDLSGFPNLGTVLLKLSDSNGSTVIRVVE